jgi:hypothetical protein
MVIATMASAARAAGPAFSLLEKSVLRVQASQLAEDAAAQLGAAEATNHLFGVVLDLRFADSMATNAADNFSRKKMPMVILVNGSTRGTAAELVSRLRANGAAVVIGSTNQPGEIKPDIAVSASVEDERKFQENPYLEAAVIPLGAFSATNNLLALVDHTSEAELVRKRVKDGDDDVGPEVPREKPVQPVIADPALARAVDLLKALALLQPARG